MRNPPTGRARSKNPPCALFFSVSTQMSIGSRSPRMPAEPVRSAERAATRSPQYVCGMKPYKQGGRLENR